MGHYQLCKPIDRVELPRVNLTKLEYREYCPVMESHGYVIYRESPYQERVYQLYDFIGQLSSIEKGALVISVCALIILAFLFFLLCLDAFVFKTGLARCHQLFPKRQSGSRGLATPGVAPDVDFFSVPISVNGIVPSPFSPVTLATAVFKTQVGHSASPEVSTADLEVSTAEIGFS